MSNSPLIFDPQQSLLQERAEVAICAVPRVGVAQVSLSTRSFGPVKSKAAKVKRIRRTVRRLRGFLISAPEGRECLVGFVVDGQVVEYQLPSRYLKSNGITEIGQPFEMDEFEDSTSGKWSMGTEFRAIAPSKSAQKVTLDLNDHEQSLQAAILASRPA